jgi:hypothetical protein
LADLGNRCLVRRERTSRSHGDLVATPSPQAWPMKVRRPQFRLRSLLILTAIVAVGCWVGAPIGRSLLIEPVLDLTCVTGGWHGEGAFTQEELLLILHNPPAQSRLGLLLDDPERQPIIAQPPCIVPTNPAAGP